MILTGKCKEDFEYWHFNINDSIVINEGRVSDLTLWDIFEKLPESLQFHIITEWFDSVGIYIHVKRNCTGIKFNHWYYIITDDRGMHMNNFLENKIDDDNRQEATKQAIIKANQIYNSL